MTKRRKKIKMVPFIKTDGGRKAAGFDMYPQKVYSWDLSGRRIEIGRGRAADCSVKALNIFFGLDLETGKLNNRYAKFHKIVETGNKVENNRRGYNNNAKWKVDETGSRRTKTTMFRLGLKRVKFLYKVGIKKLAQLTPNAIINTRGHLVALRNGAIFDGWDSRRRMVSSIYLTPAEFDRVKKWAEDQDIIWKQDKRQLTLANISSTDFLKA